VRDRDVLERLHGWRKCWAGACAAALVLGSAGPTRASAPPPANTAAPAVPAGATPAAGLAQIWYRSSAGCPDGAAFLQLLRRLGRAAALAGVGDRVDFVVSMASSERESSGRLERQSRAGTVAIRDFASASCGEVAEVLALSLDLALQPPVATQASPPPDAPASAPGSEPGSSSSRDSWRTLLGAQASLEAGLAHALLPGAALFVDLAAPAGWATRLSLRGAYGERDGAVPLGIGLLAARAEGCWAWSPAQRLGLGPCLGFDLGLVRAASEAAGGRTDSGGWSAGSAHVRASWELGRWVLEAQAGALAPLVRYDFQAVVGGSVTGSAALGISAALGGSFLF
jgi:hypothetical protein